MPKRKVIVRALVATEVPGGGTIEEPREIGVWWADVQPLQGTEQMQALQAGLNRPHRFTGWYRGSITGATELFYDDRRFNVTSVTDPGARHRKLEVLADEVRG